MSKYKYLKDVPAAVTFSSGEEVHMHQGNEYDLPEDNAYVQALLAQGFLEAVAEPAPKKVTKQIEK